MHDAKNKKTPVRPLPFGVYYWTTATLALAGLAVSAYLAVSHYRIYTDALYESFCAISQSINCDTVSQSRYSVFLGLPVPVWGVVGFVFFLGVLAFARYAAAEKKRMWSILFCVALLYSLYSLVLALISSQLIHSFCIMCILVYGICFLLLYFTWLTRRRFDRDSFFQALRADLRFINARRRQTGAFAALFVVAVFLTGAVYPTYWYFEAPHLTADIPTGITEDGHPYIGSEDAEVVITEFADYLCFQCNKMHYYLRKLMTEHPGKIKIIHRHFPMDDKVNPLLNHPVHKGAGMLALWAIYAGKQGKFWQMNDYLFATARTVNQIEVSALARAVGLDPEGFAAALNDPEIWKDLRADLTEGFQLGVSGTPSYHIDGRLYQGQIPADVLSRIID